MNENTHSSGCSSTRGMTRTWRSAVKGRFPTTHEHSRRDARDDQPQSAKPRPGGHPEDAPPRHPVVGGQPAREEVIRGDPEVARRHEPVGCGPSSISQSSTRASSRCAAGPTIPWRCSKTLSTYSSPRQRPRGSRCRSKCPTDDPKVDCNRDRVGQVLANLIDNALKFTSAGGSVTVAVDVVGATATFSVADTGPGVLDEDRAHVFEPRWHAHRLRGGGAGLGLHISKRVIDSHGGSIWCENRSPAGVTFFFTLPLAT